MEIVRQMEELGTAFNEFKKANDQRLKEIEQKGSASFMTEEKVNKLNNAMTEIEEKISKLQTMANRTPTLGSETSGQESDEAKRYKEAVVNYMRKGKEIDPQLIEWAKKDMSVDSDVDGGFLVRPEVASEMQKKIYEMSPVRQLASVQTITSDSLDIIHDLDEAGSGWVGETAARPKTDTPQFQKSNIPVHELYAFPMATQKFLDDAGVNVEAWLQGKCVEKFARDEATAFISGNGMAKPKGILAYASGTSFGQIEREISATNASFTGDDLIDLQSKLKEPYQNNATFMINRLLIGYIRKFKDIANGNYLWQPGLSVSQPATLLGRPVVMAPELPSNIVASTDTIIYGDIKAGYQIVDRIGVRVLRDPFTNKPFVGFYTTKRVGGAVKDFEAIKVLRIET